MTRRTRTASLPPLPTSSPSTRELRRGEVMRLELNLKPDVVVRLRAAAVEQRTSSAALVEYALGVVLPLLATRSTKPPVGSLAEARAASGGRR